MFLSNKEIKQQFSIQMNCFLSVLGGLRNEDAIINGLKAAGILLQLSKFCQRTPRG